MTAVLSVRLLEQRCEFAIGDGVHVMPVGSVTLSRSITGDPPRPEDLTNAIGLYVDHLDDLTRELPASASAQRVEICGPGVSIVADVEVGAAATLPFQLSRDAAEDVFRTVATETAAQRAHNPGLPSLHVHDVLGLTAAVVALLRGLALDEVWVVHE